ncbi:hypothetical protein CN300_04505 [Bacillus thuringiensis]|nr:hypothetical protein CON19_24770 [Bacillus thuringiensis]PEV08696.1 hypothetical protein CN418_24060 [Bacillus thuringiensis]PEY74479.1 hypothetical protein CN355_07680 [Bacillus thuringiensis]PFC48157.1 hypothetical protein CN300_04505 [Bacillus thuringiensis]PGV72080.1 hypothetical protein COD96_06305 [Bacillus thuringiensis]
MYLAIHILKQDLLKVLKFDLLKKTSDFIYIMEIRGFLMNVTYLIYIQAKVRHGLKNKLLDVQNELNLHQ